jgi:hypothetical protein
VWFLIAALAVAAAFIQPYFIINAYRTQERVVVLDETGTYHISPLLNFEDATKLQTSQTLLACLALLEKNPTGFDYPELLEKMFLPQALNQAKAMQSQQADELPVIPSDPITVPEPSTWALMISGALALVLVARRKRDASWYRTNQSPVVPLMLGLLLCAAGVWWKQRCHMHLPGRLVSGLSKDKSGTIYFLVKCQNGGHVFAVDSAQTSITEIFSKQVEYGRDTLAGGGVLFDLDGNLVIEGVDNHLYSLKPLIYK